MTSHKDKDFKDFIVTLRQGFKAGISVAPVWAMQKAGKRIWNSKQKRHWRDVRIGDLFKRKQRKEGNL